jgi:hypothetical protein
METQWTIEFTDQFEAWRDSLTVEEQVAVDRSVRLLERFGIALPYPYSSAVTTSLHAQMRELRIQQGVHTVCSVPSIRGGWRCC